MRNVVLVSGEVEFKRFFEMRKAFIEMVTLVREAAQTGLTPEAVLTMYAVYDLAAYLPGVQVAECAAIAHERGFADEMGKFTEEALIFARGMVSLTPDQSGVIIKELEEAILNWNEVKPIIDAAVNAAKILRN